MKERCHNKEEEPEGKERMEDEEEKGEGLMLLYEGSHKKAMLVKQTLYMWKQHSFLAQTSSSLSFCSFQSARHNI